MKKRFLLIIMLFCFSIFGFAEPPPAESVFQCTAKLIDPNTVSVQWNINKGFFLYQKSLRVTEPSATYFKTGPLSLPKARIKTDRQGRKYAIYRHQLTLPIAVLGEHPGEGLLNVHYQGCSDDGFCYPPQMAQIKLTIDKELALAKVSLENPSLLAPSQAATPLSETEKLHQLFTTQHWSIVLLSFFGFGILLTFTPCVLPMIPVLSGIIIGHSERLSTRKAFFLSLSYVLSMSITYAVVGAVVATLGSNLQILMQSPWAISLFSALFVLLALSMFNIYELRLPLSWQTKLGNLTRRYEGGHYLGAAIMGCLSTLILSPCVTAPLIGALSYIAQTGNITLGAASLFLLGLGMGTPLLLIGTSAGKWLPRAGAWMNTVKAFFGVLLLAVAIYLIQRILPALLSMGLWAGLLIFSGIYMGALQKTTSKTQRFGQGLGLMCLTYGILILIGASLGHNSPIYPLQSHNQTAKAAHETIVVRSLPQLQQALASVHNKPIVLDFYADWCTACKVFEATTLQNPAIQAMLQHFIVFKVDLTPNTAETKALLDYFHVIAPPTFLFFDAKQRALETLQLVGDVSVKTFHAHLKKALEADH